MGLNACCCTPPNPCRITWPRTLHYNGIVSQSQASFYFNNVAHTSPEPVYTLTYGPRPATIPAALFLVYFNQPTAVAPPYYTTVPDYAWWSGPIDADLFSSPTTVYFYLSFRGCAASVMVIDSPYTVDSSGNALTAGAGNNVKQYFYDSSLSSPGQVNFRANSFSPVALWGDHDADDVVPDSTGGAGYPSAVRSGP